MKYMVFDSSNRLVARYDSDIHGKSIPEGALEVPDSLFRRTIEENDGAWNLDPISGKIGKHPFPAPMHVPEQLADTVRAERDRLIESVRWRIERHSDELALGGEPTEPLEPLLQYTQDLRGVPQQAGFPESVEWPPCP